MVWSLRIHEDRISQLQSEDLVEVKGLFSGWLLCFYDLQAEPQFLSLGFYYLCYSSPYQKGCHLGSHHRVSQEQFIQFVLQ